MIHSSRRLRDRLAAALVAIAGASALVTFLVTPPPAVPTGDERDYLRAAVHLSRDGVFSHAPVATIHPAPDAYREPGYAVLLAAWWRATGAGTTFDEESLLAGENVRSARAIRRLGTLLLLLAAASAALAARGAGARSLAAAAAGVLVLASPALRQAALSPGSEGLAAALVALAGAGLVAATAGGGAGAVALAGLASGLAVVTRGAALALAPAGALLLLAVPRELPPRRRAARAAAFALLALAPVALWSVRNRAVTGHSVLADRGGQVLWTRAELDREIASEGVAAALAAWTPLDAAERLAAMRWPRARFARYEWTGEGNFFSRSLRRWQADRAGGADPIAADVALGRAALAEFAGRPLDHLRATVAVAWRGLFAERAPAAFAPLDRTVGISLGLGLLLAAGFLAAAVRALRGRDAAVVALLVAPAALFLFHAFTTEFLPRFAVPVLPLAWTALAVIASRCASRRPSGPASRS